MQQTLKRFMIPALVAMVTLLTGVAAASNLGAHTHKPFNEGLFSPSALVGSADDDVTAPTHATPSPVNRVSPAIHAATTFTVEVRANSSFFPLSVTIAPGDTVVWLRVGGFHNVAADDGSFRLGEGAAGNLGNSWTKVSHTFNTAGTFRYFCELHGGAGGVGMSGTVVVQDASVTPTTTPTATQTPTSTAPATTPTATSLSPTATATATLSPTAISTTVPPGSNPIYLPLVTQS